MLWRVARHWDCYMAARLRGCGIMINLTKLENYINGYKKGFLSQRWEEERYKWVAVEHFQNNWDINASNFGEMFARATNKTRKDKTTTDLLAYTRSFPRKMIQNFAARDAEATRAMFINLFDESKDFVGRVKKFQADAGELRKNTLMRIGRGLTSI